MAKTEARELWECETCGVGFCSAAGVGPPSEFCTRTDDHGRNYPCGRYVNKGPCEACRRDDEREGDGDAD